MKLSQFLRPQDVTASLAAPSKARLLHSMSERAGASLGIDPAKIFAALHNREKLGSTGMGEGVAIPHAPVEGVAVPHGLLVRLARPIDFESIDGIPVDVVFALLTPLDARAAHLNVLACAARRLRPAEVMAAIRAATDDGQLYLAVTGAD